MGWRGAWTGVQHVPTLVLSAAHPVPGGAGLNRGAVCSVVFDQDYLLRTNFLWGCDEVRKPQAALPSGAFRCGSLDMSLPRRARPGTLRHHGPKGDPATEPGKGPGQEAQPRRVCRGVFGEFTQGLAQRFSSCRGNRSVTSQTCDSEVF